MKKGQSHGYSPAAIEETLEAFLKQARRQFGEAVKTTWFYDGDLCPACGRQQPGLVRVRNREALSLNAFIYRERGVLIGYFLCDRCVKQIFHLASINPYVQTPLHAGIERNLIAAYKTHEISLNN